MGKYLVSRHCERSEAIQREVNTKLCTGLLRYATLAMTGNSPLTF
jgi:hypothetical protein